MKRIEPKFNESSKLSKICGELTVGDLIDTIFSHNEIISLWLDDPGDPHFSNKVWEGSAFQLPEEFAKYKFQGISGLVAESLYRSDRINIEVSKD